jgi:hypothetical protein
MPGGGPPPEIRQAMQQARDNAKTAAYNDLSADHRGKVQAIVNQVQSGSLSREDGAAQIDKVLTADESKAVLGESQKMREAMRQAFANANGGAHGMHRGNRQPDAGRFLLMISLPPAFT